MTAPRKALVTGGSGFVGSRLSHYLLENGWSVDIVTIIEDNLSELKSDISKYNIYPHDGTTKGMVEIFSQSRPDMVFHLASLFLAEHKAADVEALIRSNIFFGTQVLEGMLASGCKYIINTGTSWQHYEDKEYNPVCLYAATKQAFSDIICFYTEAEGLKAITLKLFDTYGPDDVRPKLFNLFKNVAQEGKEIAMSPGDQMLDLVYIDDIVKAFAQAAKIVTTSAIEKHAEFAVSSGRLITLKDLVDLYGRIVNKPMPISWGGRAYRKREVMIPWSKGQLLPGWKAEIDLEEGIVRTVSLYPHE